MAATSKRGLSATKSRSSGMKGTGSKSKRSGTTSAKGKLGPKLPGEKSVRPTGKSFELKAAKVSREARKPMDPRAIDRRKQVFDDPKR